MHCPSIVHSTWKCAMEGQCIPVAYKVEMKLCMLGLLVRLGCMLGLDWLNLAGERRAVHMVYVALYLCFDSLVLDAITCIVTNY